MDHTRILALAVLSLPAPALAQPAPLRLPIAQRAHETACRAALKAEIADLSLTFASGSAQLDAQSSAKVAMLADHLAKCRTMRLLISADLDDRCSPAGGAQLARARAAAVNAAFAARGIAVADRIEIADTPDGPADPSCKPPPGKPTPTPSPTIPASPTPTATPTPCPPIIIPPVPPDRDWWWWLIPALLAMLPVAWLLGARRRGDPALPTREPYEPLLTPVPAAPAPTPASTAPDRPGADDDVLRIKGIGPELKALLAGLGVTSLAQIARWDDADIAAIDLHLTGYHGRITRESWVEQARLLEGEAYTEYDHRFGKLQAGDGPTTG